MVLFGQNAYKNVICTGHVLDERGQKASKSRGNVLDPNYVFDHFGSDAIRWIFFTAPVGESYRVGPQALQEVVRRFMLPLWNVYSFFVTYARIDGFAPAGLAAVPVAQRPVLDRWLLSRLSGLVRTADAALERYDVNGASRPLEAFVEDLSTWYVRRSRRRFWKSESDADKAAAYQTLHEALVTLARLLAPFLPFLAEAMYRNLTGERSVHLADFPTAEAALHDRSMYEDLWPVVAAGGRSRPRRSRRGPSQGAPAVERGGAAGGPAARGDRRHHPRRAEREAAEVRRF